jgi:probable HAF family extracellular repeat protein
VAHVHRGDVARILVVVLAEGFPYGVNADGTVIVGYAPLNSGAGNMAVVWRGATRIPLPTEGTDPNDGAHAIDASGRIVAGWHRAEQGAPGVVTLWDRDQDALIRLGPNPDIGVQGRAYGLSADGSVVVGELSAPGRSEPFYAPDRNTLTPLGYLAASPISPEGRADAVSSDGRVVVGAAADEDETTVPFRWTQSSGMQRLGTIAGGSQQGQALATNSDGSVVVGCLGSPGQAFRWEDGVLAGLGFLDGYTPESCAYGISGDGKRVVGTSGGEDAYEHAIFVWEEDTGMRQWDVLLAERGYEVAPPEFRWQFAQALSADGNTFVAQGELLIDGAYQYRPFVVRLVW